MPYENNKCPICEAKEPSELTHELRDRSDIAVLKCPKCELVFLSSFEHITNDFYQSNKMFKSEFDYKLWQKNSHPDDWRRFAFLKKSLKDKSVLDFGCGAGGFLKFSESVAKMAAGVEVNKPVLKFLLNNGFSVLDDIKSFSGVRFDIITMFHVLEHIKNPKELLEELLWYLEKDGEIIIEVPNSNDALLSTVGCKKYRKFAFWSCHLYFYNLKNLKKAAKAAGYKINYTKYIQRYGLFNHLGWALRGEPDGHKSEHFLNRPWLNAIHAFFLKLFGATDTVIMSISPKH